MGDLERGRRLRQLRRDRLHWTQPTAVQKIEALAEAEGWPFKTHRGRTLGHRCVSLSGYQKWEASGGMKWETAQLVATVYDEDAEWLWSGKGESRHKEPERPHQTGLLNALDGEGIDEVEVDRTELSQLDRVEIIIRAIAGHLKIPVDTLPAPPAELLEPEPASDQPSRSRAKQSGSHG